MAENKKSVFAPEKAWRRLYYVYGFTSDEFYTDACSKLDIMSFIHSELKRVGYERIVLYDGKAQLFFLDEASYGLRDATQRTQTVTQPVRIQNRGLRRGKWGPGAAPQPAAAPTAAASTATGGGQSGVEMVKPGDGQLHLGVMDVGAVARQINGYMRNADIKSAIVINLGAHFREKFESELGDDFAAGYVQMGAENKNIIVFIFTDSDVGSTFENDPENRWLTENLKRGRVNGVHIGGPNASELRNMLSYFRLRCGLQYDLAQLDEIANELHRAMAHYNSRENSKELSKEASDPKKETKRIKDLYVLLEEFCKKKEPLTCDGCYSLLGISKPLSGQQQIDRLIGMQSVKKALAKYNRRGDDCSQVFQYQTASRLQLDPPRPFKRGEGEMINFVITGRPGTGKTTVARIIGQLFYEMGYLASGHLVKVGREDLVAGYVGQTAIKTQEKIQEALGGVLFVDEAYSLKREDQSNADFGQEAIDTLTGAMTDEGIKGKLIMVFAGYEAEMETFIDANPGLCSRITKLHIDDYTPEEMQQILQIQIGKLGYRFSEDFTAKLPDFCENWVNLAGEHWGNGREAETLANDLHHNWENDGTAEAVTGESGEEIRILETRHLPQEKRAYLKPVLVSRDESITALNNMVGLAGVKDYISRMRKRAAVGKMKAPGHYLFVGNPGTGKTMVARLMGQLLHNMGFLKRGHCIEYTAMDLIHKVRKAKRGFKEIAEKAINGVLFIDEAYQLLDYNIGRQILDELLPFMENHNQELCIILAGYEDDIKRLQDYNVGYKYRFADKIRFDNYSADELYQIMLAMLEAEGTVPDEGFKSKAKRVLNGYLPTVTHDRDFGNARYIREKFIPACEDARNDRLVARYGWDTIPEEEVNRLTGDDIPKKYRQYLETSHGEAQPSADGAPQEAAANGCVPSASLRAPDEAFSFEQTANVQTDSVVYIQVEGRNFKASGTGSLITRDGYILTCNHVVRGAETIRVRLKLRDGEAPLIVWEPATVIWNDAEIDAAIIKIRDGNYPTLALRPADRRAQAGENIYHWGYAFGGSLGDNLDVLEPSLFQGYVSSVQTKKGRERINTDMEAKRGCSGGPVFSKTDGAILGILCGSQSRNDDGLQEEINFVLPIRYIWENAIRGEDPPGAAPSV